MSARRTCAAALLDRLGRAPSWVQRSVLAEGLGYGETVVDEELAELVIAGKVLFNARGREYRLAGEPVARRALRELLAKPDLTRMVVGMQSRLEPSRYRVGVAQRQAGPDGEPLTLMFEIDLPYPGMAGVLALQKQMSEAIR